MPPPKLPGLMALIQQAIASGRYLETAHAAQRRRERGMSRAEILFVLEHGHHEPAKDQFHEEYASWDYSVRGKTWERRDLRVVVSFDDPHLLIITVIDLVKKHGN
jgi:hypothetical protein